MKRLRKSILFLIFIFILFFVCKNKVYANTISSIDMNIFIDSYGNANITETWVTTSSNGTEWYRSLYDLDNSKISNFYVYQDGHKYTLKSSWDVSSSFSEKAYKYGYNYTSDGVELCWGISSYGSNTYTIMYKISNFVTQYSDNQGIYFNLLKMNMSVGNVKITINSSSDFTENNAKIWGFGYNGSINFVDGTIVINAGSLSTSEYIVLLAKFETDLFNTSNTSTKSFEDVYNEAVEGSDNSFNISYIFYLIFIAVTTIIGNFYPIIIVVILLKLFFLVLKNNKATSLDFGTKGRVLPDEVDYYREIPCGKDLEKAYWVAYYYDVVSKETLKEGILGAIFLKWEKDGLTTITKEKKSIFNLRDNKYSVDLTKMSGGYTIMENKLYNILLEASGTNSILEYKEFEKWCRNNYIKIDKWFEELLKEKELDLEREGLIIKKTEEKVGIFGNKKEVVTRHVQSELFEEAVHLKGLMKFLLDFSIMPEREHFDVHIWEEYLIFASLLGIASKVEKQFSKLYPDFTKLTKMNISATDRITSNGHKGVTRGRSYSSSGSSGSGGRSSSRGGSSARGSSGGGSR